MRANSDIEVLLDDARPGCERVRRFVAPCRIICAQDVDAVGPAFAAMERARSEGLHLAGYFSYELGYLLEPRLRALLPARRDVPLLWFGVFDAFAEYTGPAAQDLLASRTRGRAHAGLLHHGWDERAYRERFENVHALIAAGDIYQANLSFRSRFAAVGDPFALYAQLRRQSHAAHGAFVDNGARQILSLSPELFFRVGSDRTIVTRPMKGTAPRGADPADDALARRALAQSIKDRAENLMIVDLLRNDLGRVARTGSVRVDELFAVESYPTLHQMVSSIRAELRPGLTIAELVSALFPCGSVTGAPKIRAMEIIRAVEAEPRGVYCGAIGHFAPDGAADFNVAIRTVTLASGRGELGIGGAVVYDSNAGSEYDECLLKARYYDTARTPIELIETLRYDPNTGLVRSALHLDRLARSANRFGIPFEPMAARALLDERVAGVHGTLRVRLTLDEQGRLSCSATALPDAAQTGWVYAISPVVMVSTDALLRHKTSLRDVYENELKRAQGCDEVLFINELGHLTEGSRTNLFARIDGRLVTPPLDDGVLDGCLRRELLESGLCFEQSLTQADLARADGVFFGNSLRGLIPARHRDMRDATLGSLQAVTA